MLFLTILSGIKRSVSAFCSFLMGSGNTLCYLASPESRAERIYDTELTFC